MPCCSDIVLNPGLIAVCLLQWARLWPLVCQWKDGGTRNNQVDERTRLPSVEVWAAATLKAWLDSDRAYLLPSSHNTQEDSKRLCLEDDTLRLPKKKGTNGPLLKQSVTLAVQICWLIQFLMKPLIIYLTTFWVLLLLSYTICGESIFNIIFHYVICSNSGFCWNWRNQS